MPLDLPAVRGLKRCFFLAGGKTLERDVFSLRIQQKEAKLTATDDTPTQAASFKCKWKDVSQRGENFVRELHVCARASALSLAVSSFRLSAPCSR